VFGFGRWEMTIGLIIIINLLNFIWITNIKYKLTIARRRKRWKRVLSVTFFVISPVIFVCNLLSYPYSGFLNLALGGLGVWFGLSQLRFVHRHSGVPQIVEPLSTLYFLVSLLLLLFGVLAII